MSQWYENGKSLRRLYSIVAKKGVSEAVPSSRPENPGCEPESFNEMLLVLDIEKESPNLKDMRHAWEAFKDMYPQVKEKDMFFKFVGEEDCPVIGVCARVCEDKELRQYQEEYRAWEEKKKAWDDFHAKFDIVWDGPAKEV